MLRKDVAYFFENWRKDFLAFCEYVFLLKEVTTSFGFSTILNHKVNKLNLGFFKTCIFKSSFHVIDLRIVFVLKREKHGKSQLLHFRDSWVINDVHHLSKLFALIVFTHYFLLYCTHIIKFSRLNDLNQFLQDIKMLGRISFLLFKLRKVLKQFLHVVNRVELGLAWLWF